MSGCTESWKGSVRKRLGIRGELPLTTTRTAVILRVPCCRGHTVDVEMPPHHPPEFIAKKMLHAGWTIGRKLTCPDHARKANKPAPEPDQIQGHEATLIVAHEEETVMAAPTPPQAKPSDAARAKKREAMDLLSLAFKIAEDGKTGQYQDGYSDAKIAAETGLSEAVVAQMREEFFAPIGVPPELAVLLAQVQQHGRDIEAGYQAAKQAQAALERRVEAVISKLKIKE